jgi:hypothetical protein
MAPFAGFSATRLPFPVAVLNYLVDRRIDAWRHRRFRPRKPKLDAPPSLIVVEPISARARKWMILMRLQALFEAPLKDETL